MANINPENNKANVLIVDDEPFILEMIEEQLSFLGYNSLTAFSGEDALHKAKEFKQIDILLTDICMPCMNGIELANEFRKLLPKTKIILMSGYVFPALDIELPKDKYPFLKKPFSLDKLDYEFSKLLTS